MSTRAPICKYRNSGLCIGIGSDRCVASGVRGLALVTLGGPERGRSGRIGVPGVRRACIRTVVIASKVWFTRASRRTSVRHAGAHKSCFLSMT